MSLLQFSHLELGLAGLTALLFLIVLLYCLVLYRRPWKCRTQYEPVKQDSSSCPPVSVVVYAQDNEENLEQHLPALLNQNYPEFEVIVVNDGISEACSNRLSLFKRDYPYLYYTFIPKDARYISKKKLALTLGIKAARHQVILFTEADCEPLSENWIRTMVESYQQKTEVVLGYAAYPYQKGWINQLIAYDNLKSGLQYLSAALLGNPFSGSGKNLSYTKDLFFKNKGFYNQLYLKIGEDNQFVNEVATSQNTLVNYSPEALVTLVLKTPKTKTSVRKIFLPSTVAQMLLERKKQIDEMKELFGDEYLDYDLVFCHSSGRPMEGQVINRALKKLIQDNDLPDVVFHSFRHASITYKLKWNGGDMKSVQGDSGHARMDMVADVYSHIIDEDRRYNAQKFEEQFYNAKGLKNAEEGKTAPMPKFETSVELLDPMAEVQKESEVEKEKPAENSTDENAALLTKLLSNPETAALLKALAKTI